MISSATLSPAVATPLLRIDRVSKRFGDVGAVDDLSLEIGRGEFFALLGPSGCGKTTLLRLLAGFETPDTGRLLLDGADIAPVLPHRRPVNMMFQNYALFPHLSVRDNIAFGLKRAALPRAEINARVAEMVALVRLDGLEARKPDQLSGGQRQRVALARALARRPRLLLLDEPLAALDKKLRDSTQLELMALQRRLGTTFVVVTHDQDEAMTMADRIGVMKEGRLIQVATPRTLYEAPNSRWIAGFVGDVNLIEGRVVARHGARIDVTTDSVGTLRAVATDAQAQDHVCLAIRPEKMRLAWPGSADEADADANARAGTITGVGYLGGVTLYTIRLDGGVIWRATLANTMRRDSDAFAAGDQVCATFEPDDAVVLTR
ncbi:MAG: spermidine/putrescine transporter ATPase subunit [Tardiphaga sp.]|nr:spermidine/putrescine transporter ATPase subunit [Tardiphaga sp.]